MRSSTAPETRRVSKLEAEEEGQFSRISVADNGIAIAPEYREQVFDLFKRLHSADEYPGTGIGLPICRRIVERYGGNIWVESTPGLGATFYFRLVGAPPNRYDRRRPSHPKSIAAELEQNLTGMVYRAIVSGFHNGNSG